MTKSVIPFDFEGIKVRHCFRKGEPAFNLTDVCTILEIKNPRQAAHNLNAKGVYKTYTLTEGGKQLATFINESNLYKLIFRSNKPKAREFEEWVTGEVLPQIRRTGRYLPGHRLAPPALRAPEGYRYHDQPDELEKLIDDIRAYGRRCRQEGAMATAIKIFEEKRESGHD